MLATKSSAEGSAVALKFQKAAAPTQPRGQIMPLMLLPNASSCDGANSGAPFGTGPSDAPHWCTQQYESVHMDISPPGSNGICAAVTFARARSRYALYTRP